MSCPNGLRPTPSNSTSSSTGRVTSRMVSSPLRTNSSPSWDLMPVLRYSIVGNFSTSRKSPLRRWPSRSSWLVLMLAVPMVAVTPDCSGSSPMVMVAVASVNSPRTLVTIMCRATNADALVGRVELVGARRRGW